MKLTNEQLGKVKQIELEILAEFIKVCETLNLKYYAIGGTVLGAARHQGFIPWDDDIDVGMPREDYDLFVSKAQEYLPKKYFLQTHKTDPEWVMHFAKIRDSETLFVEDTVKDKKMNHGIYIDVFPLDFTNKNKTAWNIRALSHIEAKWVRGYSLKGKIKRFLECCLTGCFTIESAFEKKERLIRRENTGRYLTNYSAAWEDKELTDASNFRESVELPFENLIIKAPAEYDKYLTDAYGDWRKLPPEDKRIAHHFVSEIDFDYKND